MSIILSEIEFYVLEMYTSLFYTKIQNCIEYIYIFHKTFFFHKRCVILLYWFKKLIEINSYYTSNKFLNIYRC